MLPEGGEEEKGVLSIVASLRSVVDAVEVEQAKQVRGDLATKSGGART
jgi:hypothetical protein